MHINVLNIVMAHADDMAAAACAMSVAPQNYAMFIESRDKLKEMAKKLSINDSWSPLEKDRRA